MTLFCLADFYFTWLDCQFELRQAADEGNEYAKNLSEKFRERSQKLMVNDAILSAMYADPRTNYWHSWYLTDATKARAEVSKHIIKEYFSYIQ